MCVIAEILNWAVSKDLMHSSSDFQEWVSRTPRNGQATLPCPFSVWTSSSSHKKALSLPMLRACSGPQLALHFTSKLSWKQVTAPASKTRCHIHSCSFYLLCNTFLIIPCLRHLLFQYTHFKPRVLKLPCGLVGWVLVKMRVMGHPWGFHCGRSGVGPHNLHFFLF